jgi:hypothetical protein
MTKTPNSYGSNFACCFTDWSQFELNPPGLFKNHKNFARGSEKIWEESHVAAFMAVASKPLQLALVPALETGQRQGDLLALPWSAFDGQ